MELSKFVPPYNTSNKIRRLCWSVCWSLLARPFPRGTFMPWKRFLLRLFGAKIAKTAGVYPTATIFMPWNLEMKDYSFIGPDVDCYNAAPIVIGNHAVVSQRAYLCTASHDITLSTHPQIEKPIVIEDKVWVAAESFVGPGVTIGEGAVVGARACVFKDVESWTVVGGNPAKFIKYRTISEMENKGVNNQ